MKKILFVIGTRPDTTKTAPVILECKKHPEFESIVVSTGQHKEQLQMALAPFNITVDYDLDIMKPSQSLNYILSSIVSKLDQVLEKENPDIVLVHGDTQTCVSAAMCAFYKGIKVSHIEAGLRSYDMFNPWPEEANRVITDSIATILLAPTTFNKSNLLKMGTKEDNIYITGQTQIDAALMIYRDDYIFKNDVLKELDFTKKIILVTAHRRENYGEKLENMYAAIRKISLEFSDTQIVYPVHLSPYVKETAYKILSGVDNIKLLPPLEYTEMINLMARSYMLASDSGGLQEEAPVFHKPLVLMRDTTERQEGIKAKTALLSGTTTDGIYSDIKRLLTDNNLYKKMQSAKNPFGDGRASARIAEVLKYELGITTTRPQDFN